MVATPRLPPNRRRWVWWVGSVVLVAVVAVMVVVVVGLRMIAQGEAVNLQPLRAVDAAR